MTNADKFKGIFEIYATELWSKSYKEFSDWLNEDVPDTNVGDTISIQAAIEELRKMMIALYGYDATSVISCAIYKLQNLPSAQPEVVRCKDCRHANECHKNVQYTRHESNSVTIGYSPIEWCSRGERRIDGRFNKQTGNTKTY